MPTVAVAMTGLGASLINIPFFFYYMKVKRFFCLIQVINNLDMSLQVFLNHYKIDPDYLNIAQILFMIWNAINDPLFGCVQVRRRSLVNLELLTEINN